MSGYGMKADIPATSNPYTKRNLFQPHARAAADQRAIRKEYHARFFKSLTQRVERSLVRLGLAALEINNGLSRHASPLSKLGLG